MEDQSNTEEPVKPSNTILLILISHNPWLVLTLFAFPSQFEKGKFLAPYGHSFTLTNIQSVLLLVYLYREFIDRISILLL